jgi:hypothetical protein
MPLDQCVIFGDLTGFSSTNGALRAAKEAEEGSDSNVDLTRYVGKAPATTKTVRHCGEVTWKHPRRRIEVVFQVT